MAELSLRELDAAIAEKVMGWRVTPEPSGGYRVHNPQIGNSWVVDSPSLAQLDSDTSERLYGRYAMPAYSGSIESAMLVVAWLQPTQEEYNAGRMSCRFILRQDDNGSWFVEARSPFLTSYNVPIFANSPSLPEAICRAAYKAAIENDKTIST